MGGRNGRNYERRVMRHLSGAGSADAVELDAKVPDTTGTYRRQIDVWLPRSREIVECKDYGRRVSVGVIDALAGTMHDIGALGGRVFSPSGFTKVALARAEKAGIECVQLPYEEPPELYDVRSGNGHYQGEYLDLCMGSLTVGVDTFGRVSYEDGNSDGIVLCAGYSIDWGDDSMRRFIAYIVLTHHLGQAPSEDSVSSFIEEYGDRLEEGQEWQIDEDEIWHVASAE